MGIITKVPNVSKSGIEDESIQDFSVKFLPLSTPYGR
jgi:hypothetical protein